MSNFKATRSSASGYTLARFACFDCERTTAATMQVYRMMGFADDQYRSIAVVCRTGTGCHKGIDGHAIRFGECHSANEGAQA